MERRGLGELIGSRWSWVHDHDRDNLHRNPVLVFRTEGALENPWGGGTWGEITALPAIHPAIRLAIAAPLRHVPKLNRRRQKQPAERR